jgi:hypothetical protein
MEKTSFSGSPLSIVNAPQVAAPVHVKRPAAPGALKARVMIAVPSYSGTLAIEGVKALMLAQMQLLLKGIVLDLVNTAHFSLVQMARNWLVAEFLANQQYTHLLWLDDDLGFSPDGILKLLESNKDCVGGVYTTKNLPGKTIFPYMATGPVAGFLQPAARLPGGFLLVKRHVVEAVVAGCETYLYDHDGETREVPHVFDIAMIPDDEHPGKLRPLGEDYVFCQRVLEAGHEVWARTDIAFSHFGRFAWNGKLSATLEDEAKRGFHGQGAVGGAGEK